jgi:hypothetical protein
MLQTQKIIYFNSKATTITLLVILAHFYLLTMKMNLNGNTLNPSFSINLENNKVAQAQLLKLRKFGVENGKGNNPMLELKSGPHLKIQDEVNLRDASILRPQLPSMQDFQQKPQTQTKQIENKIINSEDKNAIKLKGSKLSEFMRQNNIGGAETAQYQPLKTSGVQVKLEVPEGVKLDKLNETEMIFYGFQRRMAIQYINTLLGHIDEHNQKNPHQQFPLTTNKEILSGKITFDKEGNIVKVQLVKPTNKQKLDHFFEDVLTNLGPLQNPPDAVINAQGTFSVYYTLTIEI